MNKKQRFRFVEYLTNNLTVDEMNELTSLILINRKEYAKKKCAEQREICGDIFCDKDLYDLCGLDFRNAPEPNFE